MRRDIRGGQGAGEATPLSALTIRLGSNNTQEGDPRTLVGLIVTVAATWEVLPRLRTRAERKTTTPAGRRHAGDQVKAATAFLQWLSGHGSPWPPAARPTSTPGMPNPTRELAEAAAQGAELGVLAVVGGLGVGQVRA